MNYYLIAWYISGVASFIFWWTRDYDLTAAELSIALLAGILGPVTFFVGSCIHLRDKRGVVLMKKRGSK